MTKKMGRPTKYDEDLVERILEGMTNDEELTTVSDACRAVGVRPATFFTWVREDLGADPDAKPPRQGLYNRYARAREIQAELWFDGLIDASRGITDKDDVPAARLEIDTLKWAIGKNHIARFGDKNTVVHEGGDPTKPIRTVTDEMSTQEKADAWGEMRKNFVPRRT